MKISLEDANYADVFFTDLAMELAENTTMNKYVIEQIKDKQLPDGPIYRLSLVELETLKVYIDIFLRTGFIAPFKFPTNIPILFDKKPV